MEPTMEEFEYFRGVKVPPRCYPVIRFDGRSFSRVTTELKFNTPFDRGFRDLLVATTRDFMRSHDFQVKIAYIQSDEISCVMSKFADAFNRRIEKIDSVGASVISTSFLKHLLRTGVEFPQVPVVFDARVLTFPTVDWVIRYLVHRQQDCVTNALNSYCYWELREKGLTGQQAQRKLSCLKKQERHEILFKEGGINFNDVPAWIKRGTLLYFHSVEHQGCNHKTGKLITYDRNELVDEDCPDFVREETARNWIREMIQTGGF